MSAFIRGFVFACVATGLAACAHNVAQDGNTGPDGKVKGAQALELENGEGRSKGIVTYPGGDRVDWKKIVLPEGKAGVLELKLRWKSPRPGLDLAFEVYDQWFHPVGGAKPKPGSGRTSKKFAIENAQGTYYVQIYAAKRGDAGEYVLTAEYDDRNTALALGPIPEPPRLPALPLPPKPCDASSFDMKNPACAFVCPMPADPKWPGCQGVCPSPPDASLAACQASMPCPNPPDRRVRSCTKDLWPACTPGAKDPGNPNCDGFRIVMKARIINVQATSGGTLITVNRGSDKGIATGWRGTLLRADGKPVDKGEFVVIRVTKRDAVAKVKVSVDTVNRYKEVEISEPQ